MTVERARKLAETLDSKTDHELTELRLDPPHKVLTQIRAYLVRRSEEIKTRNSPIQLLRFYSDNDFAQIDLGPSPIKGQRRNTSTLIRAPASASVLPCAK